MCARWDTSNLPRRRSMLSDLTVCIVLHPVVSFYIFAALQATLQATVHGRWKDTHPYETKCVDNGSNTGNHPSHRARQVEGQSSLRNIMFLCISSLFDMTSYRHCIPRLTRLTHANMLCGEYVVSCSGHRNQCVSSWVWQQTLLGAPGGIAIQDKCKCMYVCMYVHVTDSHVLEWSCRSRLLEHFYILWDCGYCCYVLHAQCYLT